MAKVVLDETLLVCAVRYALGRRSYITGIVVDEVKSVWDVLERKTQDAIHRSIRDQEPHGYGYEDQKEEWLSLLKLKLTGVA